MRRLRVCHVMTADLWAGAEVQVLTTVSYLAEQPDIKVSAVLFNDGRLADELRARDVDVTILDESRHHSLHILFALIRYLRDREIDVIHTHRYKDTVLGALAAKAAGVRHVVRTMHGLREPFRGWERVKFGVYEALEKVTLRAFAGRVIAVSADMAASLHAAGYRRQLVTVLHNGIDLQRARARRDSRDVRRELGIDEATVVVGTVGRLAPVKGHDVLLRAAKAILAREPGARFVIAGGGELHDELTAQASTLGIGEACRLTGPRADVNDLMAAMDVFVLPSLNEGIPMAILEAMALGTPVVATAVGGVPEIITDGATGVLVPARDPAALATACLALARDGARARRLGSDGKKVVEERFSRRRNGDALVGLYRDVCRDARPGAWDLAIGLIREAAAHAVRSIRVAAERRAVRRMRRSPAALVAALNAGKHILVVCHGNIIRSPFAASLLAQALGEHAPVSIASAGLEAMPGRPPHPTALTTAAARRVDLRAHAASRVDPAAIAKSDVIFVMDIQQLLVLRRRFPGARGKAFLLSSLAPDTPLEIRDPVDGDAPVFQACFDHITRAVRPVAGVLSQRLQHS